MLELQKYFAVFQLKKKRGIYFLKNMNVLKRYNYL